MKSTPCSRDEVLVNVQNYLRADARALSEGLKGAGVGGGGFGARVGGGVDAEDLLQEAACAILAAWPKRRSEEAALVFALTVGRNAMATVCRRLRAAKRGGEASVRPLEESDRQVDLVRQTDLRLDVSAAIEELPPEQRLFCNQIRTYRLSRVAREVGEARGLVRSQINRMKESMSGLRNDN